MFLSYTPGMDILFSLFLCMQLRILLLTFYIGYSLSLAAQTPSYPQYYYRNPLGIPMEIQANMGEIRPDHWHMGLDIRTNAKENLPIYAAADGYIASIGVRPRSFGRFIIINHPNGLSTLYAHLNDFFPALEQFVTEQQYLKESWAIELKFTKDQFPVSKSQFIAFSGNTGGSQGPHLHFEILDTKTEKRLNPLLFGFPVSDDVPPTIVKLAMYDRSRSTYAQSPVIFSLKKTDSGYIIPKTPVIKTGLNKVSFAIQTYDKMNNSSSPDGIFSAKLFLDDEPQIQFVLDSIDYIETAYINAHTDYKFGLDRGLWLQHLSQLPGDHSNVYKKFTGDGVISLTDTNIHLITIEVKDTKNNSSQLNFAVQYDDSLEVPAYAGSQGSFMIPNRVNEIKATDFEIYLPETSLYDTAQSLYYRNNSSLPNAVSALYKVNDFSVPLHNDVFVRIKPDKTIPETWKEKILISRNGTNIKKALWEGQWLIAKFGDFGSFQAFVDVIPPQINELGKGDTINLSSSSRILFAPTDNFGIKNFRAELDSQWIRFTNDKSRNWIYFFDERCPYGVHHLKVTVEDLVGNTTTKEWWFKRYPYTPPPKKKKGAKKGTGKKKEGAGKKKAVEVKKKTTTKKK
jgi:murein DD-endopeptidase MepM/ murein hydrolase activator NlpD